MIPTYKASRRPQQIGPLKSAVLLGLLAGLAIAAALHGAELQVGTAVVDITPPVGFRKGGGYREVISTGVRDPLYAKALVLEQDTVSVALVVCDLLSVPAELSSKIRSLASKQTGVPSSNIIVAATHNHGSPEYWGSLRDIFHQQIVAEQGHDPHEAVNYQRQLVARCVEAIGAARNRQTAVTCQVVVAQQEGLAFNRRYHMRDGSVRFNPGRGNPDIVRPAGPVDTELPFLLFRRTDAAQTAVASLAVFAMHTSVARGSEFGGDYPGHLQSRLRTKFGEHFISFFAQGAAGDINHINVGEPARDPRADESRRVGETLASTITHHLQFARTMPKLALAIRSETVLAPFETLSQERYHRARSLLSNQQTVQASFLELVAAWRDCHRYHHMTHYKDAKPLEVQAVRLDEDTAVVALPHEIFVEIGMAIKASSPFRHTIVISLANDVDYYIPTRRAFEEGSYEVTTCPLNPGCGELLVATAVKLLQEVKRDPS